jgi:hypothetical protein
VIRCVRRSPKVLVLDWRLQPVSLDNEHHRLEPRVQTIV